MKNPTPEAVFAAVHDRPGAVWLDGGPQRSLLAWDPVEVVRGDLDFREAARALQRPGSLLVAAIGYGAGHHVEAVPRCSPTPEPAVWLARYDRWLTWDGRWHGEPLSSVELPIPSVRAGRPQTMDPEAYKERVRRIRALVHDGDCYQVNLSREVRLAVDDPFALYRRLRTNAAAHGAFLRLDDDLCVLSNSPELLLAARGRDLRSDPIKGTRPRGVDPTDDARQAEALLASEKDRAELAMITDLVRNDLGRVARVGSVHIGERTLVSHGNVHHTHWPVFAELAAGLDRWDALGALFPPGSVTGCPKIRACERIAELEPTPRGIYCGSIGFCTDDEAVFSVAIRTGVWHAGTFRYHVGGGVVWDSDPEEEHAETVAKGRALAAACGFEAL